MSSRETLEFVVSFLVANPDDVRIEEEVSGRTIMYDLFVHPDDVGKVIGRNGRIARAIRAVVKAAAVREDRNAVVEIID
ncbi:MAG TPA: KH domain-containing protein [Actinomycetota bacterium]|nr:KH domain-containing protein [Actinomycetota bacterium]